MPKAKNPPLGTTPAPLLKDLAPMLLTATKSAPRDESAYLAEIKYDGYRVLAEYQAGRAALRTRNGADCTKWFPEVAKALAAAGRGRTVVDGEMTVLDSIGRTDFDALHARALRRGWAPGDLPVTYCIFDLLVLEDRNVMALPLRQRKELLRQLLTPAPACVLYADYFDGLVVLLYEKALELKLEGIVAKRADSLYVPGERSAAWLKWKRPGAVPAGRFSRREPGDAPSK